jgi:hypothetical protein
VRPLFSHAQVQSTFDTNGCTWKQKELTGTTLVRRVKRLQPKGKVLASIKATRPSLSGLCRFFHCRSDNFSFDQNGPCFVRLPCSICGSCSILDHMKRSQRPAVRKVRN